MRTFSNPARVAVHDFAGHPFQLALSRELARRGHNVVHYWCPSNATPHAASDDDTPVGLRVIPVSLRQPFEKYNARRRLPQEMELGARMVRLLRRQRPHVILSSNVPVLSHLVTLAWARRAKARTVFWAQDLQSGLAHHLSNRGSARSAVIATALTGAERTVAVRSDRIVAITEDFRIPLESWGVRSNRVDVIENWAPLDELPQRPKRNDWSERHGLEDAFVFLYSGTLGLKHNPALLLHLAERLEGQNDKRVLVVSEGRGASWLRAQATERGLTNLIVLPYQSFKDLPNVLATGDVLLALLESAAGQFSVPSKLLTYHCVGRPILASVPAANLGWRLLERSGGGVAVDPSRPEDFSDAAMRLARHHSLRRELGRRARQYAVEQFDIGAIANRFEEVLGLDNGHIDTLVHQEHIAPELLIQLGER